MFDSIKTLLAALKAKKEITKVMEKKAWYKSSESWLSILTIVGSVYGAAAAFIPPKISLVVVGAVTCTYTIARAIVKLTPNTNDDVVVEKLAKVLKEKFGLKEPS